LYSKTNHMTNFKNITVNVESYNDRDGEPHRKKNKMYIWPSETLIENLENRRSRPHTIWKKEIIPLVMDWLKTNMPNHYNELKDCKWGWRQNCGCSMCPCSPGFVSNNEGYITIHVNF
jgi:hypothetical protein